MRRKYLKKVQWNYLKIKKPFKGFLNSCVHKDGHIVTMESTGIPLINDT